MCGHRCVSTLVIIIPVLLIQQVIQITSFRTLSRAASTLALAPSLQPVFVILIVVIPFCAFMMALHKCLVMMIIVHMGQDSCIPSQDRLAESFLYDKDATDQVRAVERVR